MYPPPYTDLPGKTDWEIETDIEVQLYWSSCVDANQVTVTVEDGIATLRGTVNSHMERGAEVDDAFQAGASDVMNRLVKPFHSVPSFRTLPVYFPGKLEGLHPQSRWPLLGAPHLNIRHFSSDRRGGQVGQGRWAGGDQGNRGKAMGSLPVLKAVEVCRFLEKLGFNAVPQRGSHIQYRHGDGRGTIVPMHKERDISSSLLRQNRPRH